MPRSSTIRRCSYSTTIRLPTTGPASRGFRSTCPGRPTRPPSRDRPDDRTAAADLRQQPGCLERPRQQRDVETTIGGYFATPTSTATATCSSPSSTTAPPSPATRPPWSPGPCSMGPPRITAGRSRTLHHHHRRSQLERADRRCQLGPGQLLVTLDQQGVGTVDPVLVPRHTAPPTARYTDFLTRSTGSAARSVCYRRPMDSRRPTPQWPDLLPITNVVTDPVNGNDLVISSDTGNIFSTSETARRGSTSARRRISA